MRNRAEKIEKHKKRKYVKLKLGGKMKILDENHLLNLAKNENSNYYTDCLKAIDKIKSCLDEKDVNDLVENKLQFAQKFSENGFLQNAVETTINSYFAEKFKESFKYEVPSCLTKENVDCQISYSDYKYNIEIKCPNIVKKEDDILYAGFAARTSEEGKQKIEEGIQEIAKLLENKKVVKFPWEVGGAASKDNALATYLEKTQSKVGIENNPKVINILVVSLYSSYAFSEWIKFLCMNEGLFRENTYKKSELYDEVDFVVFTSVINSHKNWKETKVNPWNFEEHFNLVFKNPYSNNTKEPGLSYFYNDIMCNHFTREYDKLWQKKEKEYNEKREKLISEFICDAIIKRHNLPQAMNDESIKRQFHPFYEMMYNMIKIERFDEKLCSEINMLYFIENSTLATEFYRSLNKELFVNEEEYIYVKEK